MHLILIFGALYKRDLFVVFMTSCLTEIFVFSKNLERKKKKKEFRVGDTLCCLSYGPCISFACIFWSYLVALA